MKAARGIRGSLADRLWSRVEVGRPDGCWLWTGPIDRDRGRLSLTGVRGSRLVRSHQAAWIVTHGPIPNGQVVRHRCDVGACCNPAHLELGAQVDNIRDMAERGRAKFVTGGSKPKTTPAQAAQIRQLLSEGVAQRVVAEEFGISQAAVYRINARKVHA